MTDHPNDPQSVPPSATLTIPSSPHSQHDTPALQLPQQPSPATPLATGANEGSDAKPAADGKKGMRRILRRPQPLNLDHSKLFRHSSAAPQSHAQASAPLPPAGAAPAATPGTYPPAGHVTIDIPPPSTAGGPRSAGADHRQRHPSLSALPLASPVTAHTPSITTPAFLRSLPRASSVDRTHRASRSNSTAAATPSPWQKGVQRRLVKIQRRKRPPNLFSWYSRQATHTLLTSHEDSATTYTADSERHDRQYWTATGITLGIGTQEPYWHYTPSTAPDGPSRRQTYSPFVPGPSTAATSGLVGDRTKIPAWVTQPSNAAAPEFYSDEAVDLLLHLRDFMIEAASKGWQATELRDPILPPAGARSILGVRRSKSLVPLTTKGPANPLSPGITSPGNTTHATNTTVSQSQANETTTHETAAPHGSPNLSAHGSLDHGPTVAQQNQQSVEKTLADDPQSIQPQQQQQQQHKVLDILFIVLADVIRHDCRYPVQHPRPSRPEWALHSIVLDILSFLCHHFLRDHRAMYEIGLMALEAFAIFKNHALVRLMDLLVGTILPSFIISRLEGDDGSIPHSLLSPLPPSPSPSGGSLPQGSSSSPLQTPVKATSPNVAIQVHHSPDVDAANNVNTKGSGFLAVPTMGRLGSPRPSPSSPSIASVSSQDDEPHHSGGSNNNFTDLEQPQHQPHDRTTMDQHATSILWSTLMAMLENICVETSPLPVVHKFFMSLSNLIKLKPNLDQDLLEIIATVDSHKTAMRACATLTWIYRPSVGHLVIARSLTPIDYDTVVLHRRRHPRHAGMDNGLVAVPTHLSVSGRKASGASAQTHQTSSKRHWRRKSLSSMFSQDRSLSEDDINMPFESTLDSGSSRAAVARGTAAGSLPVDFLAGHDIYPAMFPKQSPNGSPQHPLSRLYQKQRNPSHPLCECCDQPVEGFGACCYVCDSSLHWECYHRLQKLAQPTKTEPGPVSSSTPSSFTSTTAATTPAVAPALFPAIGTHYAELPPSSRWQLYSPELDGCRLRGEHQLILVNLFSTLLCYVCRRPLWGHQHQAYRCQACCQFMHASCRPDSHRYADECLHEHHGDIPTTTTLNRLVASFREHYQELIQSWRGWQGLEGGESSLGATAETPSTSSTAPSYEEASIIVSVLAVQVELLQSAIARQELRVAGVRSLDDLKAMTKPGQRFELFDMLEFFDQRVKALWKAQEWSVDLADYFEDDDGHVSEGMPEFLLFHSGYWRHLGAMVKTLLLESAESQRRQHPHLSHQQHFAPFGFGDHAYGGKNSGGGGGSSSTSIPAGMDDLAKYGFEVDAIEIFHHQQDDQSQSKYGSDSTHSYLLVSIFRFCSQRLGIGCRWSLRQILQAWVNMGILERQDGSLILFEQGTAKVTVSAAGSAGALPRAPSLTVGASSGLSATPTPEVSIHAPAANGPVYRSVPCLFPVVSAIDPSANVETLIQAIWKCLESENLSLNECAFQLLVRRCAPDPFMSAYSTERLVGAVFYWLALEDDHMAHLMIRSHTPLVRSSLPGVRPSIVQQVALKRQVVAPASSSGPSSTMQTPPTKPLSTTDAETASAFSGMSEQQRLPRGAGNLLTSIGSRLRGTATGAAGTIPPSHGMESDKQPPQQQQDTTASGQSLGAIDQHSETNNHPYLLTRRLLMERYALPWLEGIKELDPKNYIEMARRQILVVERELCASHTHMEGRDCEKLRHDQLERSFECIVRLKQAGFLFDLFPAVLQCWQEEASAYLSSLSRDGVLPAGFQSLHQLFCESQDLFATATAPRPQTSAATGCMVGGGDMNSDPCVVGGGYVPENPMIHPYDSKEATGPTPKKPMATASAKPKPPLPKGLGATPPSILKTAMAESGTDTALSQVLQQAEKSGSDGICKMLAWIELLMAARVGVPATAFRSCSEFIANATRTDQIYNPVDDSRKLLQLCWEQIAYSTHGISDKDAYETVSLMLITNVARIRASRQASHSYSVDDPKESECLGDLVKYSLAICMCIYGCPIPLIVSLELTPTEASRTQKNGPFDHGPGTDPDQMATPRQTFMSFSLPKHRLDKQDIIIGILLDSLKSPVLEVGGEVIAAFAALFDFGSRIDNLKTLMDSVSEALIVKIWDMLLPQNDHLVDTAIPLLMRCVASKPKFLQEMVERQFAVEDWELRFIQLDRVFGLFSKLDDAVAMKILFQHSPLERPQSPAQRQELHFEEHEPLRILGYLGPLFSCMVSSMWDKKDAVRTKAISLLRVLQPVQAYYALKAWEIYFVSSSMDVQQELCRLMTGLNNQFPGWRIMSYGLIFDLLTVKKPSNLWESSDDEHGGLSRRTSLSLSQGNGKQAALRPRSNSVASIASLASGGSNKDSEGLSSRLAKLRKKLYKQSKAAVPINVEARPTRFTHSASAAQSVKSSPSVTSANSSLRSDDSGDEMDSQLSDDQLLEHMERQEELAREDDLYCSLINLALQMVANGIEPTLNEVIQLKYLVVFYLDFEDCELLNIGDGNQQVHFGQYFPHHDSVYDPGHETFVLSICTNLKLILDRYVEIRPESENITFGSHPLSTYRCTSTLGVNASGLSTTAGGGSSGGADDGVTSLMDPLRRRKSQEQMLRDYVLQQQQRLHHPSSSASGCTTSDGTQTFAAGESDLPDPPYDPQDPTLFTHRSHRRHYHQQQYVQQQQYQRHIFPQYQKFYNRRDRQDENAPVVGTYFVDVILRFFGAEPDLAALPTERLKNWLELFLIVIYKYVSEQDPLQDYIVVLMRKIVDMLMMKRPLGSTVVRLDDDYVAKENILLGISICHTLLRRSVKMTALILSREIMAMGRLMTRRRDDPEDSVRIKAHDFLRDAFEMFLGNGLFLLVFKNQPVPKDAWTKARIEDDDDDDDDVGDPTGQGHEAEGMMDHQDADLFFVLTEVLGDTEMVPQDPTSPHSPLVLLRDQPVRDVLDRVMVLKDLQPMQVSRILTNLWLYIERVHSSFHDPKIMADFGAFVIKLNKYMSEWGNSASQSNMPPMTATVIGVGTAAGQKLVAEDRGSGVSPSIPSQGKALVEPSQIQQFQEQYQRQQQINRAMLEEKQAQTQEASVAGRVNETTTEGVGGDAIVGAATSKDDSQTALDPPRIIREESMSTTTTVMTPQAYMEAFQLTKPSGDAVDEKTGGGSLTLCSSQESQPLPKRQATITAQTDEDSSLTKKDQEASFSTSNLAMSSPERKAATSEAQSYAAAHLDRHLSESTIQQPATAESAKAEGSVQTGNSNTNDPTKGTMEERGGTGGLFGIFNSVREYFSGDQRKPTLPQQHGEEIGWNGSTISARDVRQKQQQQQQQPSHPLSAQPPSRFGTVMSTIRPTVTSEIRYTKLHAATWDIANPVLRMCAVLMVRLPSEALVLVPSLKVFLRQALYRDALSPEAIVGICAAYAFMAELDLTLELTNAFGEVVIEELKAVVKGARTVRPLACNLLLMHHLLEWQQTPGLHPRWTGIKLEYLGKMRFPPGQPVLFPGVTETLRKEVAFLFAD